MKSCLGITTIFGFWALTNMAHAHEAGHPESAITWVIVGLVVLAAGLGRHAIVRVCRRLFKSD